MLNIEQFENNSSYETEKQLRFCPQRAQKLTRGMLTVLCPINKTKLGERGVDTNSIKYS